MTDTVLIRGADGRVNMPGADLRGANLKKANLRGANLKKANLEGANLEGADVEGADLHGANLRLTVLYGVNLEGAKLEGAKLYGANLYGATLPKRLIEQAVDMLQASQGEYMEYRHRERANILATVLAEHPDASLVWCRDEYTGQRFGRARCRYGRCAKLGRSATHQLWAVWDTAS